MYAKSYIALDGNGRLTGARTAQTAPYDRYTCHLCGSILQYHPEYITERPWFEHAVEGLTKNGQQHCPYVKPDVKETRHIRQLQSYVPDARPLVFLADWHCSGCGNDYHGERYCLTCCTGDFSNMQEEATL
ncbi:putative zinc ribbon protein [Klebsiella oxytoca]